MTATTTKSKTTTTTRKGSKSSATRTACGHKAVMYAKLYTGSAVVLSAGLNAYSSVVSSESEGLRAVAAGAIGAIIPLLVWLLGTVTALTYKAGWKRLAMVSGAIACCVLALSVCHVAAALAALTGTGWIMAGLLAVGIDCGMVSSEATAVLVGSQE